MKTKNVLPSLILISFILALCTVNFSTVQAGDDKISIGEKVTLQSKVLDEERKMLVYLPDGYDLTTASYPVMYLLDGGYHFLHVSGVVQFLSGQGIIPQTIVVAITNVDRGRDFTPTKIEKKANTGGAEKFMSFISEELMPYVNKNYRTQPYEILVGHSLGGTFATYALLNNPEVFDAYMAISPYLAYDDNFLVEKTLEKLQASYNSNKFFYMTLGDEPKYTETVENFVKTVKAASPDGLELKYVHMEKEDHGSIPHLSIYNGLETIYAGWKLPKDSYKEGLATIDEHYKMLSDKYGYEIETPEYIINIMGYTYMGDKEFDKAIKVLKENVKRYPKSANVYDSLGEAYEKNDQMADAKKNYEKSVAIAEKEEHAYLKVYRDNLNRVQEILAER